VLGYGGNTMGSYLAEVSRFRPKATAGYIFFMYCDGPCDWWESAFYLGFLSLWVVIPLVVTYALYRLIRRIRRNRNDSA
jgi:hypothetical protein